MNVRTIKVLHVKPHNDLSGQWNENRLYSNLFNILLCAFFLFFQHFFSILIKTNGLRENRSRPFCVCIFLIAFLLMFDAYRGDRLNFRK